MLSDWDLPLRFPFCLHRLYHLQFCSLEPLLFLLLSVLLFFQLLYYQLLYLKIWLLSEWQDGKERYLDRNNSTDHNYMHFYRYIPMNSSSSQIFCLQKLCFPLSSSLLKFYLVLRVLLFWSIFGEKIGASLVGICYPCLYVLVGDLYYQNYSPTLFHYSVLILKDSFPVYHNCLM